MTNFRFYDATLNPALVDFWREYAQPGCIGLIHLDSAPGRVINWAEHWVTPTHELSRWAHTFMFLHSDNDIPRSAESDARISLPGFEHDKPDGPQINTIYKWSHRAVDEAAVVDPCLNEEQMRRVEAHVNELIQAGIHYPRAALANTLWALAKGDLDYVGPLAADDTMHCSQLVQECLLAAGASPFPPEMHPRNIVPEHFAQSFPQVAHWKSPDATIADESQ